MEKLEIIITVLLLLLVAIGAYIATSWTLFRKKKQEEGDVGYKHLEEEEERSRKRVANEYAQETMPKITITPVQPRPDFPRGLLPSDDTVTTEDEDSESEDHPDLGRLYFALRYDQHRSMLIVRLIRAEDIPSEREVSGTYVDVHLLPLDLQSRVLEPYETTINVCFREVYEFPLTQSDMAQQTLNLHICRYDNFSRRTSIGDVFLALAELSAQGIDFTREVFLCRNIISHQEIYRTLGRRKRMRPADQEEHEGSDIEQGRETPRKGKFSRKSSTKRMWDVLRRAVWSGAYKRYGASETAMYWESMFPPDHRSATSVQSPRLCHFSGPGPPGESQDEANEDEPFLEVGDTWESTQESKFRFPERESEMDSSANELELEDTCVKSSASSPVSSVQLSATPEEYYRIVPITPFTPVAPHRDKKGDTAEPSFSWQVPQSFTSVGHDVVETLSQAYKQPRIVHPSSCAMDPGAPQAKKVPFDPVSYEPAGYVKGREQSFAKSTKRKTTTETRKLRGARKVASTRQRKKLSPRKDPDGQNAEELVKSRATATPKVLKMVRGRRGLDETGQLSTEPPLTETTALESLAETTSRLAPEASSGRARHSSLSAEEYRTPLMPPLKEFYKITRAQSDPDVSVEHARTLAESRAGLRLARSMLEIHESDENDE